MTLSHLAAPAQKVSTVLKLKLGSSRPTPPAESSKPPQKPSVPKTKKQKAVDIPPLYIDDDSHDLLYEAIATEELEPVEKSPFQSSSSKQRKVFEFAKEEEILSLAVADSEPVLVKRMDVQKMSALLRLRSAHRHPRFTYLHSFLRKCKYCQSIRCLRWNWKCLRRNQYSYLLRSRDRKKRAARRPLPSHVTAPARPRKSIAPVCHADQGEVSSRDT